MSAVDLIPPIVLLAMLAAGANPPVSEPARPRLVSQGLSGYISMEVPPPPDEYGYGVSLYAAAWPLVDRPIRDFQIGLASIWIVPENRRINEPLLPAGTVARDNWPERGPSYRDVFETIEGGLGFWASTRFGSATAKFRMNGTPDGYNHELSSPLWGFGDTTALPPGERGIVQISPRLLVPPDGLTFRKDTLGDLLGYAWMALPLIEPKAMTAGLPVPTGGQCWTLFLNAKNFKGPVAFYAPAAWSRISRRHPPAAGRGLDARPGLVTGGAIEVNAVPRFVGRDAGGATYARIPRLQFPVDENGRTVLIRDLTHYSKAALYQQAERWAAGGPAASGRFDLKGARVPPCKAQPLSLRQGEENLPVRGCENWLRTIVFDGNAFGLEWNSSRLEPWTGKFRRGSFPEYFKREGGEMEAVTADQTPDETGLKSSRFPLAESNASYVSPEEKEDVRKRSEPRIGPFRAKLADGSVVTYFWYRFRDQPSLEDADLSEAEKDRLQRFVEKIHVHWTSRKEYLPPPQKGDLVGLDPALLVRPPRGAEVGYVPIAVRQSPR
jgi:hypothetical protein